MFRKLLKNKKAQNTAEYAILISLVVAGIIAMQTYAQRALQSRVRDASKYLKDQTTALGNTVQYEPYYLSSDYNIFRNETESEFLSDTRTEMQMDSERRRAKGGFQESSYSTATAGIINGI